MMSRECEVSRFPRIGLCGPTDEEAEDVRTREHWRGRVGR